MEREPLHKVPVFDPVSGRPLYIRELASDESGVSIRGRFEIPRFAQLTDEQARFLETFLRCRGVISGVEKELGISYPTVRNRLDQLLEALELAPLKEVPNGRAAKELSDDKRRVLDQLESGEISPEEAKKRMRGET